MSNTGFYLCTECFWSGNENDLNTVFGSADEQVCPICGAFEECVPQSEVVILTDDIYIFPFISAQVPRMLSQGWHETALSVQEFIKYLKQ